MQSTIQAVHKKVVMSRRIYTLARHIARLLPTSESGTGELTGLDEHGNALLRGGGGLKTLDQMPMAQPA